MAAYSSGASWSFPEDLPGAWQPDHDHDRERKPATRPESPPPADNAHNEYIPHAKPEAAFNGSIPQPKRRRTHYPPRQCRICLEVVQPTFHTDTESSLPAAMQPAPRVTYESDDGGRLLSPCKCKGSQRYVHEDCLNAWRRADPTQKRNYWECPTCRYRYKLQRLTWSAWISSTSAQLGLTFAILIAAVFLLGFVADPIINMYIDPVNTVVNTGGRNDSLIWEDEPNGWFEHMLKGLASLGLVGFAKFLFTLSPFQFFQVRTGFGGGRSAVGGSGRDRLQQLSWITLAIGITTVVYGIWKAVRAWSRRTLENAGERVLDVPGVDDDDDDDEEDRND